MRKTLIYLILATAICAIRASGVSLQNAYDQASPGAGYDKYVILNPGELYTGGLYLANGSTGILSAGAQVDLQGGLIAVEPGALLDVAGVVFTGSGAAAIDYTTNGVGWVDHCTFYGNNQAINAWYAQDLMLTSNVFSSSAQYGVYRSQTSQTYLAYNDAWENPLGHYMEWCPG